MNMNISTILLISLLKTEFESYWIHKKRIVIWSVNCYSSDAKALNFWRVGVTALVEPYREPYHKPNSFLWAIPLSNIVEQYREQYSSLSAIQQAIQLPFGHTVDHTIDHTVNHTAPSQIENVSSLHKRTWHNFLFFFRFFVFFFSFFLDWVSTILWLKSLMKSWIFDM